MQIVVSFTGSLKGVSGNGFVDALPIDELHHSDGPREGKQFPDENSQLINDSRDDDPISLEDGGIGLLRKLFWSHHASLGGLFDPLAGKFSELCYDPSGVEGADLDVTSSVLVMKHIGESSNVVLGARVDRKIGKGRVTSH